MATKTEKLLGRLDEMFEAAIDHPARRDFATNSKQCFEYREGRQWTEKQKKDLEDRGQAPIVENEIQPVLDRVNGQYKRTKARIGFRGRNIGSDENINNVISDIALFVQQNNGYEFEEGDMFDDGQVCGFGAMEVGITFDDVLQPEIKLKHDDSLDVFVDPQSLRYDWNEDAKFLHRARWVSINKAEEMYPSKKKELRTYANSNPAANDTTQDLKHDNYVDTRKDMTRVRLIETWYKEYTKRTIVMYETDESIPNPEGGEPIVRTISKIEETTDWSKKRLDAFLKKYPEHNVLEKTEDRMFMAVWCGRVLLENKPSPYKHNLFPFVPYFVYRKKSGEPYSYVWNLLWPQSEINKRRSKALHLLNTNQVIMTEGAVQNEDETREQVARPDGIVKFKRGHEFTIEKNIEVAQSQMALLQESKQAIGRLSVSDEARGLPSEVRSGIGIQRKQMMSDLILMPIFDNLRRTRLMIGRLIFELIKQYYTEEKTFHVTDSLGAIRAVELTREVIDQVQDLDVDTIIEEMPDTTTIQDEQFNLIANFVQGLGLPPQIALSMFSTLIKLSQIRNKEEILADFQQSLQNTPPEQPTISLGVQWDKLNPMEKAALAQTMGNEPLAQAAGVQAEVGGSVV